MSNWGQISLQDSASMNSMFMAGVHDSVMVMVMFIVTLVSYLGVACVFSKLTDLKFYSNEILEMFWVLIPMFSLMLLAVPSLHCLYLMEEITNPILSLKCIGHQWFWSYEYDTSPIVSFDSYMLDSDSFKLNRLLETDNALAIPYDSEIRILVTSTDVVHSWSVPSMGVKMDAVPGRINQLSLVPKKLGSFYGQCSEMCGYMHSFMPIAIQVLPWSSFVDWVNLNI